MGKQRDWELWHRQMERERQWTPTEGSPDCPSCGSFLPNEYHDVDCAYVAERRAIQEAQMRMERERW